MIPHTSTKEARQESICRGNNSTYSAYFKMMFMEKGKRIGQLTLQQQSQHHLQPPRLVPQGQLNPLTTIINTHYQSDNGRSCLHGRHRILCF